MASERDLASGELPWSDIPDPLGLPPPPSLLRAPVGPSPTRAAVRRRRALALVAVLAWVIAMVGAWGIRDLSGVEGFVAAQVAIWVGLLALTLGTSLARGRHGLGSGTRRTRGMACLAPLAFMAAALVWTNPHATAGFGTVGPMSPLLACFGVGVLVAIPVLLIALWGFERSFAAGARWRSAAVGAAAGLAGAIVLTLHCGSPFGGHIALAHGLPIVVGLLAGALAGERVARA